MLPSASIGFTKSGEKKAMYEPVHGSAPDIAGKGICNPLAMILSVGMMFKYSFNNQILYELIDKAVSSVLSKNFRTKDISSNGSREISTSQMGDEVIKELENEKI